MKCRRLAAAACLATGLVLAFFCASSHAARAPGAADLCVHGCASIQDAINAADGGDLVRVPVGHYTETLVITESITLQGGWDGTCASRVTADPVQTVIDANGVGSVVRITDGEPKLESLTVAGGADVKGGGVFIDHAALALDHVLVSGNLVTATTEPVLGAGIFAYYGTVVLRRTDVVSNAAFAPAGLWALGVGISVWQGNLMLDHSSVISNVGHAVGAASVEGSGVYSSKSIFVLHASRISSNTHSGQVILRGGGIRAAESDVRCEGKASVLDYNQATEGGGIYMDGYSTLSACRVMSNTAATLGGGIAAFRYEGGSVTNAVVAGNAAGSEGSGVYVRNATVAIANYTLMGNKGERGHGDRDWQLGHSGHFSHEQHHLWPRDRHPEPSPDGVTDAHH
jgi:hypothetical protein